jgi:hypothetical protein
MAPKTTTHRTSAPSLWRGALAVDDDAPRIFSIVARI